MTATAGHGYRPIAITPALGEGFFDRVRPAEFPRHVLRYRNDRAAAEVGLDDLSDEAWIEHFARFAPLPGSLAEPLALRYHGHQFRAYNPALGDGRGFVFAQLSDEAGRAMDLGTKGSGKTPWSRGGDGRLTLKGGVREILATEMLEALGVATSRTFSVIETGEALQRGDEPSPTRSCVLVRLSHGHVRFGTFQRYAYERDVPRLRKLLAFSIEHYLPEVAPEPEDTLPLRFFREVARRSAELAGAWMAAGFVHGVLNTDNMNITGESFDYGPYRFLPKYDPMFVAAYFDHGGLYAFARQPESVRWNLERLAESLSLIDPKAPFAAELVDFEARVMASWHGRLIARLGLRSRDAVTDSMVASRCLCFLREADLPFDRFFFDWWGGRLSAERAKASTFAALYEGERFAAVLRSMDELEPIMTTVDHPYLQRAAPPSLVIDAIESVWKAIDRDDDWEPLKRLIGEIRELGAFNRLSRGG